MTPRTAATTLALALGLPLLACGGTTTVAQSDAGLDATPRDGAVDRRVDDGPPGDVLPGDGGADAGPATAPRFLSETAGGARLVSPGYRLELFVAPTRPTGATSSAGYQLKLGPGALRNAR